jgi:hypothetical protein
MPFTPSTRPETWVPAGQEAQADPQPAPQAPEATPRKARPPLPPKEAPEPGRRLRTIRGLLTSWAWTAIGAALPWAWFLVRDLGGVAQLVAVALPVLVVATLVGLAIAAIDARKVAPLVVAASVAAFGWTTIIGPRSAQPAPAPRATVSIVSANVAGATAPAAVAETLSAVSADLVVALDTPPAARDALRDAAGDDMSFLESGRFAVLSALPLRELPAAPDLSEQRVLRFLVEGRAGDFVVYAVQAGGPLLDAALDDRLDFVERLRAAARSEDLPVVLAGNFNLSDRTTGYRELASSFRDAMRANTSASATLSAWFLEPLVLRVDHLFTTRRWCAKESATFEVPGADHVGMVAAVGPCAGPPASTS